MCTLRKSCLKVRLRGNSCNLKSKNSLSEDIYFTIVHRVGYTGSMSENEESGNALNPTVVKLGLVSLFADISSEMLYPITPIFLTAVLGASMTSLGLIEGCAEAMASLLKTYFGAWSDRVGRRKPFIVVGYLLTALSKPLIGFAGHWPDVLFARGLDRAGKGMRGGPRDALIADAVHVSLRGAAFGWHRAMDTLGAAIGPLLAIVYLHYYSENLRWIYFLALIPGLIAVMLTLSVKEKRVQPRAVPVHKKWAWSEMPAPFRRYLVTWTLFSLTNSSDIFLLMKAKASGVSLTTTIFIYCFYNMVYALSSPGLGKLSDRVGRKPVLTFGFLIFAAVYAGFAFASELWHFWVLFGIYGLYIAATDGVGKAFAVDLIGPQKKATGLGILGTVTGIFTLIASTTAGFFWDHLGPESAFIFGSVGAFAAAFSLIFIQKK